MGSPGNDFLEVTIKFCTCCQKLIVATIFRRIESAESAECCLPKIKTNFIFWDRPQCEAAKEQQLQNIAVTSRKLFPGLPKSWYYCFWIFFHLDKENSFLLENVSIFFCGPTNRRMIINNHDAPYLFLHYDEFLSNVKLTSKSLLWQLNDGIIH